MKNSWKSCLALWLSAAAALGAAIPARGEIRYGLRLGWTSGQLRAVQDEGGFTVDKFAEGGVALGLTANLRLTPFLALQPEILYFQKGGGYNVGVPVDVPGVTVGVKDVRNLNYLEIPLLLKLSIPLRGIFRPTFLIGPSVGWNLSGNLDSRIAVNVPGYEFIFWESRNMKSELNDFELSAVIGGGFDLDLRRGTLSVDSRFYFGLKTNGFKVVVPASKFAQLGFPPAPDLAYDLDMYNYVWSLSVGFLF